MKINFAMQNNPIAPRTRNLYTGITNCAVITAMALVVTLGVFANPPGIPKAFIDIKTVIPDLVIDLRYHGSNNFVGEPIEGYTAHRAWMTKAAATQLAKVQEELRPFGLGLLIFDTYRPQMAVDHFARWAQSDKNEDTKAEFYPSIERSDLFEKGFIAERSSHTRGSAVDLSLASLPSEEGMEPTELDMGTAFDFFGPASATLYPDLLPQQRANRMLLKTVMEKHGFVNYSAEWWHFRLKDEPFPRTYFNIPTGGL